jgi:hypothetical protein
MHEQANDGEQVHQELVAVLRSDFTPENFPTLPSGSALKHVLARAVSTDELAERFASPANLALGARTAELVADTVVTDAFKAFIVNEVRQAHAWERPVDEAVSPSALGLTDGEGIFDRGPAQAIEARTLRGALFDLVHRHTLALKTQDETGEPVLVVKPTIAPRDYVDALDRLLEWRIDYAKSYGEDPFAGQTRADYTAAAPTVDVPPDADLEAWVDRLKQLRDDQYGAS